MKADVYSIEGKVVKHIELPSIFKSESRDDLIKRAVLSEESKMYQPKGSFRLAGLLTSARYRGRKEDFGSVKNKGIPHLPHEVLPGGQLGKVKRVPHAVKGRRAHPPKPQKKIVELLNKKEYLKALSCALSMALDKKLVTERMNSTHGSLVMENGFEKLAKTKDVVKVFEALKLSELVEKAKKTGSKAPLIVVSSGSVTKAAANLSGVDVVRVKDLQVRHLAPGTHGGRLTIFSENAIPELVKRFEA
ncbi:MAG: 50S ribosomal protein L4 [Candidatus Bilamarchaeum sp.]|jgi:large subunit ribosomal protein L4e